MSQEIRTKVQEFYAERARDSSPCCAPDCCGESNTNLLYETDLLTEVPTDIANFTLGCGDPITLAELQEGEAVLDLGSGGGLDCFLAAKQVGESGYVIGIDMTPEMLGRARNAAGRMGFENVEFRQGYLEEMPVENNSIDVVISNCVINLSPDKSKVFSEMYRVLKPGGRVSVSDIVTSGDLPESLKNNMEAWGACVAGALEIGVNERGLRDAGFTEVKISAKNDAGDLLGDVPSDTLFSAAISARKD
jgi:arsenite methyltransferase